MLRLNKRSGFTLVELLVSLVIVAVLTGAAVTRLSFAGGVAVETEAERVALLLDEAYHEALNRGETIGWSLQHGAYRFWKETLPEEWEPLPDEEITFVSGQLRDGIKEAELLINGTEVESGFVIPFTADGGGPLFTLTLQREHERVTINSDPLGRFRVEHSL